MVEKVDVVIIGAGAAGLMCAITAGYRGRKVLVLDHANKAGKKILMSGGGRCNFTHLNSTPANYLSNNPHYCISALRRYTPQHFVEWVERHGIEYHEKTPGQLFCNESSKDILNMLLTECDWAGAEIRLQCSIDAVEQDGDGFRLQTSNGVIQCESLVIASGGLSIPTLGASPFGYKIAEQFGLKVLPTRAGLAPFTLQPDDLQRFAPLSGVSCPVSVSVNGVTFKEPMLFTHRGLSGPSMLQISSFWKPGQELSIDLLPDDDVLAELKTWRQESPNKRLETYLNAKLPKRVAQIFTEWKNWNETFQQCSNQRLQEVADALKSWKIKPNGTEGYRTAEVTLGGVDTDCLSSKTMAAKDIPNLYFIGEVVDVTGHLGGHNFQWAWASGFAAGGEV
ncbi:NAD(P)/FAD-dependent oxidoreductase [Hahella sp. CR1]|uniref:NAD(P)/FAD-dependent oxidoreductase n=1 Tax=Hahella sp. CR1 TaxID=2992807 RepID=UPI00244109CD|nr:NAD(P)/FAD-dependent oxidoreductase [Hahella sp. CR1]MDG9671362.1 NAD(P)/FAD-dependent oxidoreductase [Hahella sp. CR1]